jgi:hypothetical protein
MKTCDDVLLEGDVMTAPAAAVVPEAVQAVERRSRKELGVVLDTDVVSVDAHGAWWLSGLRFMSLDALKLFFIASRAKNRLFRAIALQKHAGQAAKSALRELEANLDGDPVTATARQVWSREFDNLLATASRCTDAASRPPTVDAEVVAVAPFLAVPVDVPASPDPVPVTPSPDDAAPASPLVVAHIPVRPDGLAMRVVVVINGVQLTALNDTGADISVMNSATAARLHLHLRLLPDNTSIQNPNGTAFDVLGAADTVVAFPGHDLEAPLRVVVLADLSTPLILGADFLTQQAAILSYGDSTVTYRGVPVKVVDAPRYHAAAYTATHGVAALTAADVHLAPHQCTHVLLAVALPEGFRYAQYAWRFESCCVPEPWHLDRRRHCQAG